MLGRLIRLLLFGLCLGQPGACLAIPLDNIGRAQIEGQTYLRLRDWVSANTATFNWVQPRKSVKITRGNTSMVFSHDSKIVTVNGITVWMSFPAVIQSDRFYVSLVDMKTTVLPLMSSPKSKQKIDVVALDPGHGGRDRGFYQGSRFEKNYTLLLAQEVRTQLTKLGLKVVLTRSTDEYVERSERPARAKARQADLFVSLHFNSGGAGNSDAKGVETYCITPVGARSTNAEGAGGTAGATSGNLYNDQSVWLAYQLQRTLVRSLGMEDRGVRRARFEVLREAEMPAVLIEAGFMSHPSEGPRLYDPVFRRKIAKSIAEAIVAYKQAAGA